MPASVLDSLTLGYQLLWNSQRQVGGVQLFVGIEGQADAAPIHAQALLAELNQSWSASAPQLILSTHSIGLLGDLLRHTPSYRPGAASSVNPAPSRSPWIEVPERWLDDATLALQVHQAYQRGVQLVWRGDAGQRPSAAVRACFARRMLVLTPEEALLGLRAALQKKGNTPADDLPVKSPVERGQIYEAVASWVLAEHCLDQRGVWALAGWPVDDVLHGYRHQKIQPGHRALVQLIKAVEADEPVEWIEQILSEEPILTYRFMRYVNSVGLGLRSEVESIRQGLLVLGFTLFKKWLMEQLPHASSDLNLQPVRSAMVLRARLMENLLAAGVGNGLRLEAHLCGLLSQIDTLLDEPLTLSLQRFPLPERITAACLENTGPYAPYLEIAKAVESANTRQTHTLCMAHGISREDVNRALLYTLATVQSQPAPLPVSAR